MSNGHQTYERSVRTPNCVSRDQNRTTYSKQFREAKLITNRFENTPVQILADDVGTGKTWVGMMTIFSCLESARPEVDETRIGNLRRRQHAVIIAPSRMVAKKWIHELNHFNRYYVENPHKTAIDKLSSTCELLDEIKQNSNLLSLADGYNISTCFNDYESISAKALLLRIIDISEFLHNQKKRKKIWDFGNFKYLSTLKTNIEKIDVNSKCKSILSSILPQRDIAKLIDRLRIYSSEDFSDQWYKIDFDQTAWLTANKSNRNWSTWVNKLQNVVKNPELNDKHVDTLVQIASVLWGVDQPSQKRSKTTILTEKNVNKWINEFNKSVPKSLLTILNDGLPDEGREIFEQNTVWQQALQKYEIRSTNALNNKDARRLVVMLAALTSRLESLAKQRFTIADDLMNRFTAAGVFKSLEDLDNEIFNISWQRLFTFIEPVLTELIKSTTDYPLLTNSQSNKNPLTRSRNFAKIYSLLSQRLARNILQLIDYELHPERVGSTFWFEQVKERAIHVMHMNDIKVSYHEYVSHPIKSQKSEPDTKNEYEHLNEKLESIINGVNQISDAKAANQIVVTVVDEAHNWRKHSWGARSFEKYIKPLTKRVLLVTATPLQMSPLDLKNIIDIGLPSNWKEDATFAWFQTVYDNLFKPDTDLALDKATSAQKRIDSAWHALLDDKSAIELIEQTKKEITGDISPKQLQEKWEKLADPKLNTNKKLLSLAMAVVELCKLKNNELLNNLRQFIVKRRADQFLADSKTPRRRYLCGKDASQLALNDSFLSPKHLRLYPTDGLPNRDTSWADLLGMRLSQLLPAGETKHKNARLLTELPSSYKALKESATFKFLSQDEIANLLRQEASLEGNTKKRIDSAISESPSFITRQYIQIFKKLKLDESEHPKVSKTVNLAFNNFLQGEKTLIFCQRLPTVDAIKEAFELKIERFKKELNIYQYIDKSKDSLKTIDDVIDLAAQINSYATWKGNRSIPFASFETLRLHFKDPSNNNEKIIENYDARLIWLINTISDHIAYRKNSEINYKQQLETYMTAMNEEDTTSAEQGRPKVAVVSKLTGRTEFQTEILNNFSSPFYPVVLICSPVSQEGVDMHKFCSTVILHDLNWNPAVMEQRVGRLDRVGSYASVHQSPVDIYVPFLADSYDEYQYSSVLQRAEMQELVFGRNDNVITDDMMDSADETCIENHGIYEELAPASVPLLGPLIHGLFDMDLSPEI